MLTTEQAAQRWGVAKRTVQQWIARGKLPDARKIGRDWLIPDDTLRPSDRRYVDAPVRNRRKNNNKPPAGGIDTGKDS